MFPSDPVFCLGLFLWTGLKMQHFFPPPTLLLSPPYAKHRGKKFKVPGSFWPGGPTADKDTLFLVRILESDDKYKVNRRAVVARFWPGPWWRVWPSGHDPARPVENGPSQIS